MDVGSKEVLMESPPVSVIVCVCMCVVGLSGLFPHPNSFTQLTQDCAKLGQGHQLARHSPLR